MATLVLSHLSKIFPAVRAVDDLTLEAAPGELLVLMGPSGCGKTTILRMIAGMERPTTGTIAIAGRAVDGLPPRKRDVAMVFQQGSLYPHLSVYDNLAFGLRMRGTGRAEIARRIVEAATALGIDRLLDRRPGELSGGQQQRVALGRAMVRRPRLFLFDEPLSSLDAALRTQLREEIRRLHARLGTTMIYVTHDQTEAMALGERIAVLGEGRLRQVADPQTLYDRPAEVFVAGQLGSPAMNFFAGRIEPCDARLAFVVEGQQSSRHSPSAVRPRDGDPMRVPIAGEWAAALEPYAGQPVTLGVRPEHVVLLRQPATGDCGIAASIDVVEHFGAESHVYLSIGGRTFLARVPAGCEPRAGESVSVSFSAEHLHFFDEASGRSLRQIEKLDARVSH